MHESHGQRVSCFFLMRVKDMLIRLAQSQVQVSVLKSNYRCREIRGNPPAVLVCI
jgi:hypothetical protein